MKSNADFQSAVSPIFNRQTLAILERDEEFGRPAELNSAIQQIGNLRYSKESSILLRQKHYGEQEHRAPSSSRRRAGALWPAAGETSNSKLQNRLDPLKFGARCFPQVWSLVFGVFVAVAFLSSRASLAASTLSDPAVDSYNTRVGTQTFSGLYQFTTNNLLIETAQGIHDMGSENIKMYLGANFSGKYHTNLAPNITSLLTLARDEPNCRTVLDMPFRRYIAWAYPLSNPDAPFMDGNYTATEAANDYREMYDLTRYLLTNYNNSGKTFYLGHWEGDGYLSVNNWSTNPPPAEIPAMIAWLNNRQKAIDDAKAATEFTNVNVFGYSEVNRVRDAMNNGTNNNVRSINYVIPYVTNLDYVSYSSYDAMNLSTANLYTTLDYIEAHIPTNKAAAIPGERLWIGEYGWGGNSSDSQEPLNRAYIQRLLNYGQQAFPFILFWEIYDNETNKNFWLIDTNNVKVPSWYLHQRFINNARLFTAQFKETNHRLPSDTEFVSLVSPTLNQPLPAPINLSVSNAGAAMLSPTSATVSGLLAQGVYGDDCATVKVFWGRKDGGTTRAAWEQSASAGLNTNFNPTTFTISLTNLPAGTNIYFRFYATNASGEAWAPSSTQLISQTLNPSDYPCRIKIAFTGYNRSETLSNFPALVNFGANVLGFSYSRFTSPVGGDLRFTDAGGFLVLPHEIDEWNPSGTSTVWVRVPRLAGTNDFIWAYWGNPAAAALPSYATNGTVWSSDHYAVWHLKETGLPYADSSQQHPAAGGSAGSSVNAMIGHGISLNGSSQYLDPGPIDLGQAFTISAWVKLDATATNCQTILANKPGGWNSDGFALFINSFNTADQEVRLETGNGTAGTAAATAVGAVAPGVWHRVAAVIDKTAGSARLYIDGADRTTAASVQADFANQTDFNVGRCTNSSFYLKGTLDEVRIESLARSSNWVWASWMSTASNNLLTTYSTINPRPTLSTVISGPNLCVSWPTNAGPFTLFTTTNLAPPVTWLPATNTPVSLNDTWQIQVPASSGPRLYRLQQ
jgi:hypothetical protein